MLKIEFFYAFKEKKDRKLIEANIVDKHLVVSGIQGITEWFALEGTLKII